jgi:hypothetical protein
MNETRNTSIDTQQTQQTKKTWHVPTLEETSYTATEMNGVPGGTFDGYAVYSVV